MQVQPNQAPRAATPLLGGLLLVAIGLIALIGNLTGAQLAGGLVLIAIGVAFAIAYALTRKYGFLVPAGILGGLGGGVLIGQLASLSDNDLGMAAVLGLGTGFVLIYLLDAIVTRVFVRFWPLIPGAVMFLVAGGMATNNEGFLKTLGLWSPIVLVAIGLWLLVARSRPVKS
jgi:hypothetical protein